MDKPRIPRKDAARYAACRKASAGRLIATSLTGGSASFDLVDKPPRGQAIFMMGFGLSIAAFLTALIIFSEGGSDNLKTAIVGTAIFGPIAVALSLGGAGSLYRRDTLSIKGDTLSYDKRSLFAARRFSDSLDNYACVLPESQIYGSAKREMRMAFYARLVHRSDDALNVAMLVRDLDELGMLTDRGGERGPYEALARSLDLPLATEAADGSVSIRHPDELDIPLAARASLEAGPERPFPSRRYRVTAEPGGFSAERGYPVYLIPFAGFVAAAAASLILIPDTDAKGGLFLVCCAFSLFMLAFSLTRARLTLRNRSVEALFTIAGIRVLKQTIPLDELEEVDYVKDPRYNARTLRLASDRTTIQWGQGDKPEELAWFRDAIVREIGTNR